MAGEIGGMQFNIGVRLIFLHILSAIRWVKKLLSTIFMSSYNVDRPCFRHNMHDIDQVK